MKLGFSLKKSKKKPLLAAATADKAGGAFEGALPARSEPEKVFVTDFDPSAVPAAADGSKALVIPLIAANEWREVANGEEPGGSGSSVATDAVSGSQDAPSGGKSPAQENGGKAMTADEAAAKALLAEARGEHAVAGAPAASSALVIPLNSVDESADDSNGAVGREEEAARAKKKAELFQDAAQRQRKAGEKPILQQNAVPGLDKLADVKEKYQRDVSLRPDELDVHNEAYTAVPIEEFGAAMLRGMGWKGAVEQDDDADSAAPKPRHKLLGLGATMRPPLPGDKGKRKKKHQSKTSKDEPPSESQRRAGMNRPDDDRDKRRRSDSREQRTRDDSRSRSDQDARTRRRRDGDEREDSSRSASRRDRSRSRDRRGSDRRDNDRASDSKRKSRDRHRRERSRSGDRDWSRDGDRDHRRSSRR